MLLIPLSVLSCPSIREWHLQVGFQALHADLWDRDFYAATCTSSTPSLNISNQLVRPARSAYHRLHRLTQDQDQQQHHRARPHRRLQSTQEDLLLALEGWARNISLRMVNLLINDQVDTLRDCFCTSLDIQAPRGIGWKPSQSRQSISPRISRDRLGRCFGSENTVVRRPCSHK